MMRSLQPFHPLRRPSFSFSFSLNYKEEEKTRQENRSKRVSHELRM